MENNVHICMSCKKIIKHGVYCLISNLFFQDKPLPMFGGFSYKEANERAVLCKECYERFKPINDLNKNDMSGDYIF